LNQLFKELELGNTKVDNDIHDALNYLNALQPFATQALYKAQTLFDGYSQIFLTQWTKQ